MDFCLSKILTFGDIFDASNMMLAFCDASSALAPAVRLYNPNSAMLQLSGYL